MIQTYNDIQGQVRQFERDWNEDGQLQKVYGSARFVTVSLRSAGKTTYLYFGRGKGYEGFWVSDSQVPSPLRKKDRFVEYLRKRLTGARLLGIKLDEDDRIVYVDFQKFGQLNRLGLFYNGRKLYLACHFFNPKKEAMELFKSWQKGGEITSEFGEPFTEVGKTKQDKSIKSKTISQISNLIEQEEKEGLADKVEKKKKSFLKRKRSNIEKDLEKAKRWIELSNWIKSIDNFESLDRTITVAGHKLKFKEKAHFKRRDEVFTKIKKLKKGQRILEERLRGLDNGREESEDISKSILKPIEPVWSTDQEVDLAKVEKEEADGFVIVKEQSFQAGIGISAKGNDQLRKKFASKNDWWFHLDGETSSHIIIKTDSLDMAVIEKVAELMKKYSKLSTNEVNLIYTQVKNLKGIAGVAGSVNYKKEKHVRVYVG